MAKPVEPRRVEYDTLASFSDRTLRHALGMTGMGVWQRDLRTNRSIRSPNIDAMFGFAPGEAGEDAAPFQARIHPDDLARMNRDIAAAESGGAMAHDFRVMLPDGTLRWLSARGEVVRGADGGSDRVLSVIMDITERKRAEKALRSSEDKLQLAIDAADLGLWDYDIVAGALIWSDRLKAMYGLAADARVDFDTYLGGLHPDDRERAVSTYERALDPASGGRFRFEHRIVTPAGAVRWILGSGQVIFDAVGNPVRAIGTALDITERKRTEQAFAASEARLQLALDAARLGTYERDLRTDDGAFSAFGAALHGLPPEQPSYTPQIWLKTIHQEDRARVAATVQQAIEGHGVYEADYRVVWPDGQMRWVAARGEITKDEAGRPVRAAGIVYDITDRKQAEEALRANEEWLRLAMAAARVGAWSWSAATGLFTFSDWLNELLALPRGHALTRDALRQSRIHADDHDRARGAFDAALAERGEYDVEYRVRRPDGALLWVRVMGRGEYDAEGSATGMIGIIQDITERKRAEQALRDNETRLRIITDTVPGAITYIDADMRYGFVNAVFEDWFGRRRDSVVGRPVAEVLSEADYLIMRPWAERALAGENVVFERTFDHPGRARRHLLVRLFPDRDEHGPVRGFYALAIDITDRKEGEERLKLLAAEVDHRAKNMLALVQIMLRQTRADSVKAYVNAAQGRIAALARAHALLSEQRWVGADLARLVQDELAPYRTQERRRVLIDGPTVALSARAAQSCALVLHELTTNAAKYGSLSAAEGRVECTWHRADGKVVLTWRERGGPAVRLPDGRGFGMNVIERSMREQLEGEARFDWRREGLLCTLVLPAHSVPG